MLTPGYLELGICKSEYFFRWIVQDGRTPAIIFSLPDNASKLISISANVAANMVSTIFPSCSAAAPEANLAPDYCRSEYMAEWA